MSRNSDTKHAICKNQHMSTPLVRESSDARVQQINQQRADYAARRRGLRREFEQALRRSPALQAGATSGGGRAPLTIAMSGNPTRTFRVRTYAVSDMASGLFPDEDVVNMRPYCAFESNYVMFRCIKGTILRSSWG